MKNISNLSDLRQTIDKLDQDIIKLLNERASLALQVGESKKSGTKYNPSREAVVIKNALQASNGPMPKNTIEAIYREIIGACLSLQQPLRIGYLGPSGTYSEEAALKQFGSLAQLVSMRSLDQVLESAQSGNTDLAILPIENSSEGSVNQSLDLLVRTPLVVCGEILLPIHHQLLTNAKDLKDIREVLAHPQSLAQCRQWLADNLPQAKQIPVSSNGEAAKLAAKASAKAAIASQAAAKKYKLTILSANIEDQTMNTTRFITLGDQSADSTGDDKTSLICSSPHEAGGLLKVLSIFAEFGVNMTKLESRPKPDTNWDYIFFIDVDGHQQDQNLAKALRQLKEANLLFKILGSYPKVEGAV